MNSDSVRAFVAVEVSSEIRAAAQRLRERAAALLPGGRWVPADRLHLTLAFLGDIAHDRVPEARQALDETAPASASFTIEVAGLGSFGPARSPRVLWAGLSGDLQALTNLQAHTVRSLVSRGFSLEERAFSPHLTLARFRRGRPPGDVARVLAQHRDLRFGSAPVGRLLLMRSDLGPDGPDYSILHEAALITSPPEGCRNPPAGSG